jgi:hypothetical protein
MQYRKFVAAFALALCAVSAHGAAKGEVGRLQYGELTIVLTSIQEGCPSGMTRLFAAIGDNRGTGCWTVLGEDVFVKMEDGSGGTLPKSAFQWVDA